MRFFGKYPQNAYIGNAIVPDKMAKWFIPSIGLCDLDFDR